MTRDLERPKSSWAMMSLAFMAAGAALYVLADLMIPVTFAILIYLLLLPPVRWLGRRNVPTVVAAGLLILMITAILVTAVATLASPADRWLAEAPRSVRELQKELSASGGSMANIKELADEVDQLAKPDAANNAPEVVVSDKGTIELLVGGLPNAVAFAGIVFFLSFFLLASGDSLVRRITRCGRSYAERRRIVSITRQIQADLSRYLITVTGINAVLGLTVAFALYLMEVPNPLLWGAMVYLLNFAPYAGALISAVVLTLVGMMTFDTVSDALMVPGVFLVLTILEGQLITPAVLGQRMSMSPIVVFVTVIVWGWMWGIFGALMAVPILTSFKVVCDHVPKLRHVALFLRRDDAPLPDSRLKSGNTEQAGRNLAGAGN
ncbi:MAG: AI-2E family transporter [Woeseiaceae bacterium]|nr:AI-2E family transporter [Woeseiaceae bacterium]